MSALEGVPDGITVPVAAESAPSPRTLTFAKCGDFITVTNPAIERPESFMVLSRCDNDLRRRLHCITCDVPIANLGNGARRMTPLPTSCQKPAPREKKARKPMERKAPIARGSGPKRKAKSGTKTGMMRRETKLAKVNPERQAKRRKAYAQKLAAYKRSETYRLVAARAEGRCEHIYRVDPATVREYTGKLRAEFYRCETTTALHHHHKTYARFGGKELPEDIAVLCERHHELAEAAFPHRQRYSTPCTRGMGT